MKSRDTFTWAICLIAFAAIAMVAMPVSAGSMGLPPGQSSFYNADIAPICPVARTMPVIVTPIYHYQPHPVLTWQPRYILLNPTFQSATTTIRIVRYTRCRR